MKAIILKAPGGTTQLEYTDIPVPVLREGEVLVRVRAISINPVDIKSRSGKGVYGRIREEDPLILGWDISGTVEKSNSHRFRPGDKVFGMVNFPGHGKAYAEYVAAPAEQLALKPENQSHTEAAAATLVALTAWQALITHAQIQQGQHVLIHAASGGVGHMAVQIAKHIGATVTGTSSAKNRDFVLQLGADHHIDYRDYDWQAHPREFDMVLDTIGGGTIDKSLYVTKAGGTIISIPTGLNETVTEKAAEIGAKGYTMLVRSSGEDMQAIAGMLGEDKLKAHLDKVYPFESMAEAHTHVESGRTVGKVTLFLE
ncbi:NADP-dependent oxidoreductase [Sinomicrobium oceani]|nr:NADP-dependent oxidoreductase [Sinomicrobium oceani]